MQVFKAFMMVLRKRLGSVLLYVGIFIGICVMMTYSTDSVEGFKYSKLDISVTDLDDSPASHALADYISENHNVVELGNDKDKMIDMLFYREVDIILTINEGYSGSLENGITDDLLSIYCVPGDNNEIFFKSRMDSYHGALSACIAGGMDIDAAALRAAELAEAEIEVETVNFSENNAEFGEDIQMFFQYLAYILIVTLIAGLCPTLLVMTQGGIRSRTSCSCISVTSHTIQLVSGALVTVMSIYLLLIGVAAVLFGSELFSEKGLLAMLNSFVYLIFSMMLTLFIAVLAPGRRGVDIIANTLSLGMSFLCGVFVPQSLLSGTVLAIGKFLPAYWYVKANNMIAGSDGAVFTYESYFICIAIELAFSAALFCVTLLIAKTKQRSAALS